jgi:hypothetical protein
MLRHRMLHVRVGVVLATVALAVLAMPSAGAARTLACKSSDLRYPFQPGGPKTFGVFKLRITGGRCSTARHVARDWMSHFEAGIRAGRVALPRFVDGFAFKTLPATAAQTYRERGRRARTTIRFDYVVPNG